MSPPAQSVDENRSASLTAIAVNDPAQKGVTWSLAASGCAAAACGALSNQTVTSVTYTAPNPVTAGLSVSVVATSVRSEEHTSELQSRLHLVCRLLLEKKN